jgi:hypothetical protein
MGLEEDEADQSTFGVVALPPDGLRSDLIHRPGVGTPLWGKAGVEARPKTLDFSCHSSCVERSSVDRMRCMITASLRASAILALLMPARPAARERAIN